MTSQRSGREIVISSRMSFGFAIGPPLRNASTALAARRRSRRLRVSSLNDFAAQLSFAVSRALLNLSTSSDAGSDSSLHNLTPHPQLCCWSSTSRVLSKPTVTSWAKDLSLLLFTNITYHYHLPDCNRALSLNGLDSCETVAKRGVKPPHSIIRNSQNCYIILPEIKRAMLSNQNPDTHVLDVSFCCWQCASDDHSMLQ